MVPPNDPALRRTQIGSSIIANVGRGRTINEILDDVYRELKTVLPYDRIAIVLIEPDRQTLRLIAVKSNAALQMNAGYVGPIQGSSLGEVVKKKDAVILNDLESYLKKRPASEAGRLLLKEKIQSTMALPLVSGEATIGALTFSSRQPGVYTPEHAAQVRQIADQIAIATEKAQLIATLSERNDQLKAAFEEKVKLNRTLEAEVARRTERERLLLRIAAAVNASLDIETVFRVAVGEIRKVLPFDRASITLLSETGDHMRFRALEPPEREILGRNDVISVATSSIGRAIRERRAIVADDLDTARSFPDEDLLHRAGIRSYVFTPLVLQGKVIGCFNVASNRTRAFGPDDIEFLAQVTEQMTIAVANAKAYEEIQSLKDKLHLENLTLKEEISTDHHFFEIVGSNPLLTKALRDAERVALTDATVLVLGETGTGKELIARAIHRLSSRRDRALVKVNCAALPETLLESELFGHEKGAFTGAVARKLGRFEMASGGTIFLDEIGELTLEVQAKILRVLQDGEFERVGGTGTLRADVRVIAATNRDLETAVGAGAFRQDLFYRLNVFPITVPPLRERPEDIEPLARHFISKYAQRFNKKITRISVKAMQTLAGYRWPGNIRELENLVERAVIVCDGDTLEIDPRWLHPGAAAAGAAPAFRSLEELESHLNDVERGWFEQLMKSVNGRIYGPKGAAALLGLKPTTLQSRLKKLGLQ